MLEAIYNAIVGIGNFFSTLFGFVGTLIDSFLSFIGMLTQLPGILGVMFSWLPSAVGSALLAVLAIAIVYKLLGRE